MARIGGSANKAKRRGRSFGPPRCAGPRKLKLPNELSSSLADFYIPGLLRLDYLLTISRLLSCLLSFLEAVNAERPVFEISALSAAGGIEATAAPSKEELVLPQHVGVHFSKDA